MTSTSSYGLSQITLQFNLGRDIDAAAQDVQSAISSAGSTLPRNLPYPPHLFESEPADAPVVTLAVTSDIVSMRELSDLADTLIASAFRRSPASAMSPSRAASGGGAHQGRRFAPRRLRPFHLRSQ